ncbi:MAG: response regulator, partial [Deltaproteobacteria bacterium]|nr:response regulator [Deltaproteobacteria bacterium]
MSTILIVEDHAISRQALKTLLGYYGHRLLEAADGSAALALARSEHPELIISDIVMPTMDGLEFVRRLREEENGRKETPVIFYTAVYRLPEAYRLVGAFGSCSVIPKPSEPTAILEAVHKALGIEHPAPVPVAADAKALGTSPHGLQLATLMDLGFHLVSQRDPDRLAEVFCTALCSLLNCGYIELVLTHQAGEARRFGNRVATAGDEPLLTASELEQLTTGRKIVRRESNRGRMLAIPFATPARVYGWFCIAREVGGQAFGGEDEEMAVAVSSQAALAYENILLVQELKAQNQRLQRGEERLRLANDSAGLGTFDWHPQTGELILSANARAHLGLPAEGELAYDDIIAALHPDDRERVDSSIRALLRPESGGAYAAEYRPARISEADEPWVASRGKMLYDEEGRAVRFLGTTLDITERRRFEEGLSRAREAAESAARAKSEFLANMSHEIRTPMNAIIGFTDLLLAMELTDEQRRYLDLVKNSGEALLDVVNDVLDLSKMEAGKFDFVDEPFDLRDLTEKIGRSLALRAHQKGLELTTHVPFSVPTSLLADPGRLRQVLANLLGNAVKFTEHGEVHLSVREVEPPAGADGRLWLRFSIKDTGIGIAPEKLDQLFQSFQQLDPSSTRRHEGTGLGLFISRRIVEQMGGRIQVQSEKGKGSTFSFTVPFRVQQGVLEVGACEKELPELRGQKVLVVDDNPTNRMILVEMLGNQEMEVSVAGSGEEALGLLRAANGAKRPYELLIVDCQMPGMDGFQLIERVKRDRKLPQPVIVMITSDDLPAYCGRARKVGAAAYLVKPVSCAELIAAVRTVLGTEIRKPVACEQPSAPDEPEADESLRVLLVEDNLVNQILVRTLVERKGWSIEVAEDGRAALEVLSREPFDVVLMDVQMP